MKCSAFQAPAFQILIVEDEALIGATLTEGLVECGFRVRWASTGEDALALLRAGHCVDALVTDLHLGAGMDGFTLSERVRQFCPGAAVMYVSGRWAALDRLRGVAGAAFLPKPCTPDQVAGRLRALLGAAPRGGARTGLCANAGRDHAGADSLSG